MPNTPVFGWPYQSRPDAPHGPNLGEQLALAIEATVSGIAGLWLPWDPTLGSLTLGNGTVIAKYRQVGKTVDFRFKFTLGSTSAVGTDPAFTLPVTPHADYVHGNFAFVPVGHVYGLDFGTATYAGPAVVFGGNTCVMKLSTEAPGGWAAAVTATSPFTWGTSDMLAAFGSYEAA